MTTVTNGNAIDAPVPDLPGAVDLSRYVPDGEVPERETIERDQVDWSPDFPLSDYTDALTHLRRPFSWNAVKFKVQAAQQVGHPRAGRALIVAYIDARLVIERLHTVVGGAWSETPKPGPDGRVIWMQLDVMGVSHVDVGEDYSSVKALMSDALKRAAVKHGIGVSLYAVPRIWFDHGQFLWERQTRDGKTYDLTADGEHRARELYYGWLKREGEAMFGPVLGHGDAMGSVGEALDAPPAAAPSAPAPAAPVERDPIYDHCFAAAREWVGDDLGEIADDDVDGAAAVKAQESRIAQLRLRLVRAGAERDVTSTRDAIDGLNVEQAHRLYGDLRNLIDGEGKS